MVNTLRPPPEVIASWPAPNYTNPETRGDGLVIVAIVLASLGVLMVAARLYSRFFITKAPGFDDALVVLSLMFAIALSVLVIIGNRVWFSGHHIWDIPPDKYVGHRLNVWIAQLCSVGALACVKISVLLFYRRLSVTFSRTFMIATWVGIIYNVLYWLGFYLALLLGCQPVNAYWDSFDHDWAETHTFSCGSEQIAVPVAGALSVIGDFYSALLPMLLIMSLDLPRRQKLSLYALFAIAFLVVGAGIARTILSNIVINRAYDFTWHLWEMWIWGLTELWLALLAASAPALKPFVRRFLVEPMSSVVDSGGQRNGIGYGDRFGDRVGMNSKGYTKGGYEADPERIGVAYGGSDTTKSREESFVREVDDEELETRRFELRQSHDGRKMVPMQIWRSRNSANMRETDEWPVPPIDAARRQYFEDQKQGHIRNFSQPHSYKSSGDTATGLLSQQKTNPSQMQLDQRSSDPQALGEAHVMQRLSHGSVKAGRLRAQQVRSPNSRGSSVASPALAHLRSSSRNGNPPQYEAQQQINTHPRSVLAQRNQLRQPQFINRASVHDSEGHGSRLDPPSDSSDSGGSFDEPRVYRQEMYTVEKPSVEHSRSTSEETLHLPRMGSRDDMVAERRREMEKLQLEEQRRRELEEQRRRELEEQRRRELVEYKKREEEKEIGRRWRREGSLRG